VTVARRPDSWTVLLLDSVREALEHVATKQFQGFFVTQTSYQDDVAAIAARVAAPTPSLGAEERLIIGRLRDNAIRSRAALSHLGVEIAQQCDEEIRLFERLLSGLSMEDRAGGH
jgi:hypothetical protein